jgi:hypothetical protein
LATRTIPRADGKQKTLADELAQGERPFWTHIRVKNLIDVRTARIKGREVITHARWWEYPSVVDGFTETCIPQIRVVEIKDDGRVWWMLFQQQEDKNFAQIDSGVLSAMTEVALVRIFTGKKKGNIACEPWTYQLAQVNLQYYRAAARQNEIETFSGWPILAGQGIQAPTGDAVVEIGPHTTLFAPPTDSAGGA